jgi:hypothetical protein
VRLGIDDKLPSHAEAEKQATVRDLLMAARACITRRPTKQRTFSKAARVRKPK